MKKFLLLVPALLGLVACGHVDRVPTTKEIQRRAPPGTLVRVIVRDRLNPYRATAFTVDVSRDEIVDQTNDPAQIERMTAKQSDPQQQAAAGVKGVVMTTEVSAVCEPKDEKEGCLNVANLTNGDPPDNSPSGPTGHEELQRRVRRLAGLSYWAGALELRIVPTQVRAIEQGGKP
ncbi:hypothetical protein LY474_07485 [Myxococcus stipitatus]|uniref:hypothetical protein n=1 Tax=Myxococcus stipitatus TaxID=83455 RepID=UPI001F1C2EB4|nr:hypothetical protein [Myxococcus stipitatus]MCE9667656.1 hypothetical protein [Myxococcus stipitatus]